MQWQLFSLFQLLVQSYSVENKFVKKLPWYQDIKKN